MDQKHAPCCDWSVLRLADEAIAALARRRALDTQTELAGCEKARLTDPRATGHRFAGRRATARTARTTRGTAGESKRCHDEERAHPRHVHRELSGTQGRCTRPKRDRCWTPQMSGYARHGNRYTPLPPRWTGWALMGFIARPTLKVVAFTGSNSASRRPSHPQCFSTG